MLARARATSSEEGAASRRQNFGGGGFWETVLAFFMRSGPWAVLSLLLLLGIFYEAHIVLSSVGAEVSSYVATSGRNLQALMDANEEAVRARIEMQASLSQVATLAGESVKDVAINGEHIRELQTLMQSAYNLMKDAPQKREEQTQLLRRIEGLLMELNQLTAEATQNATDKGA